MIIRSVGAELFHTDGRTDRHDELNICFNNFANAPETCKPLRCVSMYDCSYPTSDINPYNARVET